MVSLPPTSLFPVSHCGFPFAGLAPSVARSSSKGWVCLCSHIRTAPSHCRQTGTENNVKTMTPATGQTKLWPQCCGILRIHHIRRIPAFCLYANMLKCRGLNRLHGDAERPPFCSRGQIFHCSTAVWFIISAHKKVVKILSEKTSETVHCTHRAADDVVLVWVPTDVSHAGVMARQFGYHRAGQNIVGWTHKHFNHFSLMGKCSLSSRT